MSRIEHADALTWLAAQEPGSAQVIVYDPPYSRWGPMRGKEDGAAGSVAAPFSFLHRTLSLCAPLLVMPRKPYHREDPVGVVVAFGDFELLPDLRYTCSITGLREQRHLLWVRPNGGGGHLFRGACDPVLIASMIPPRPVDEACIPNWYEADYDRPRKHPYSKPVALLEYVLKRV